MIQNSVNKLEPEKAHKRCMHLLGKKDNAFEKDNLFGSLFLFVK